MRIIGVRDQGKPESERLLLKAESDLDIGHLLVLCVRMRNDVPTTGIKRVYWFPDKQVQAGDLIVLYTKSGTATEKKNEDGTTSHFYYWRLTSPAWGEADDGVVLVESSGWQFQPAVASEQTKLELRTDPTGA